MAKVDLDEVMDEILYFLRNNITDPKTRPSSQTDEFDGDNNTKTFTLTKNPVMSVTTVTVGGASQSYGDDYTVTLNNTSSTVTFTTAPGTGTNNVDITYKYGTKWIYPDSPETHLSIDSFPRISLTWVTSDTRDFALGGTDWLSSVVLSVTVFGRNDKEVRDLINDIKDNIMDSAKSFYNINYIKVSGISPVTIFPIEKGHNRIVQQSIDLEIPFIYES